MTVMSYYIHETDMKYQLCYLKTCTKPSKKFKTFSYSSIFSDAKVRRHNSSRISKPQGYVPSSSATIITL